MFNKTFAVALLAITLGGQIAHAQPQTFVASDTEACADNDCDTAKLSAKINANEICAPQNAQQVGAWEYRTFKAGYLFMTEVSARFTCD